MSERGIEIHNGEVVFPEGMPQTLHIGTEASPLTQGVADQIIVSAVVNALALGGTVEAGLFIVIASVSLTAILQGLRSEVTVNDGITVTPSGGAHTPAVFGAIIKAEVLGAGVVGGRMEGLRIEMSSALGSTTQSAFEGIFISNYNLGTQSAGNYVMIRAQENGTYTVNSMFYLRGGTGGVNYFAVLHGDTDAWRATFAISIQSGFIKVLCGGLTRYLALYTTMTP